MPQAERLRSPCFSALGSRAPATLLLTLFLGGAALAGEAVHPLAPDDALAVVELNRPLGLLEHPLIERLWREARRSSELQRMLASPEVDRLRRLAELLESGLGVGWREALEKLTAGGVVVAVSAEPKLRVLLVVTADEETTVERIVGLVRDQIRAGPVRRTGSDAAADEAREGPARQAGPAGRPQAEREQAGRDASYRGVAGFRLGPVRYAVVGRRLVAASDEEWLKATVDRLLGSEAERRTARAPRPRRSERRAIIAAKPLLRVTLNLEQVRRHPGIAEAMRWPAPNAGPVVLLGGLIDVVRRSDYMSVELAEAGEALQLRIGLPADTEGLSSGLEGFFAPTSGGRVAAPLKLPGTIYTASWYRDYGALWDSRRKLLTAEAAEAIEKGDRMLRKQLSVIGGDTLPSALFQSLGPHFRLAVARSGDSAYRVDLRDRLPAAALCVDLRDEQTFRQQYSPLARGISLIAAFGEAKMLTRRTTYKGAELSTLRFRDDEAAAESGNRLRYNFSPTHTVARGHFILGSTEEIVRQVIDELGRQAENVVESLPDGVTAVQRLSFPEASKALSDYRRTLVNTLTLASGMTISEAEHEVDILSRLLESLGRAEARTTFDKDGFEYRASLGLKD